MRQNFYGGQRVFLKAIDENTCKSCEGTGLNKDLIGRFKSEPCTNCNGAPYSKLRRIVFSREIKTKT